MGEGGARVARLEQSLQDADARAAELQAQREAVDKEHAGAAAKHQEEVFKLQVRVMVCCV